MRMVDPGRFPNVVAALRERRARPDARARPGLPRRPLRDGRRRRRPATGRSTRPRPLRVGESLLHRPARRQPAGVQLAQRVLRVRRAAPRRAALDEPARPPRARRRRRTPIARRRRQHARRAVARRRDRARRRRASRRLLDDPHPLARAGRACALAREESRGAHVRARLPRARSRRSTGSTSSSAGDDARVLEFWDLIRARGRRPATLNTKLNIRRVPGVTREAEHIRCAGRVAEGPHRRPQDGCTRSAVYRSRAESSIASSTSRRSRPGVHGSRPRCPARVRGGDRAPRDRPPLLRPSGADAVRRHPRRTSRCARRRASGPSCATTSSAAERVLDDLLARTAATSSATRSRAARRRAAGTPCQRTPLPRNGYCPSHQHLARDRGTGRARPSP